MVILETTIFTKKIDSLLSEEAYRALQNALIERPICGDIIQGSGGVRKIRWGLGKRGKRGGTRIIYYWATNQDQIYMLYAYAKNESENLTKDQLSILKKAVAAEFNNE